MNNIDTQTWQLIIVIGIPFAVLVLCWVSLMITMHKTTGELKYWLTPDYFCSHDRAGFSSIENFRRRGNSYYTQWYYWLYSWN